MWFFKKRHTDDTLRKRNPFKGRGVVESKVSGNVESKVTASKATKSNIESKVVVWYKVKHHKEGLTNKHSVLGDTLNKKINHKHLRGGSTHTNPIVRLNRKILNKLIHPLNNLLSLLLNPSSPLSPENRKKWFGGKKLFRLKSFFNKSTPVLPLASHPLDRGNYLLNTKLPLIKGSKSLILGVVGKIQWKKNSIFGKTNSDAVVSSTGENLVKSNNSNNKELINFASTKKNSGFRGKKYDSSDLWFLESSNDRGMRRNGLFGRLFGKFKWLETKLPPSSFRRHPLDRGNVSAKGNWQLILGSTLGVLLVLGVIGSGYFFFGLDKGRAAGETIGFSNSTYSIIEKDQTIAIPVILSSARGSDTTVTYSINNSSTATNTTDYIITNPTTTPANTLTIPAGQTTTSINLKIINDSTVESTETVVINLSSSNGATLTSGLENLTFNIIDDDSTNQTYTPGGDTLLPADPDSLTVTSGRVLHLDANASDNTLVGNKVSTFKDQSGNNNDATQTTDTNRPTLVDNVINGKKVVNFNGSNQALLINSLQGFNFSGANIFAVSNAKALQNTSLLYSGGNTGGTGQPLNVHAPWSNGNVYFDFVNATDNQGRISGNWGANINTPYIWNFGVNATGGQYVSKNGSIFLSGGNQSTQNINGQKLSIGNCGTNPTDCAFNGDIAEVLVYNRSLNTTEQTQVQCYLAKKYNLQVTGCTTKANVLNLDANTLTGSDGSSVSTWTDASGLGNNATQTTSGNQPKLYNNVLNGKKVVRFDGADDYLQKTSFDLSIADGSGMSLFIVPKWTTVGTTTSTIQTLIENDHGGISNNAGFVLQDRPDFVNKPSSLYFYPNSGGNGAGPLDSSQTGNGSFKLIAGTYGNSSEKLYINSALVNSNTNNNSTNFNSILNIGRWQNSGGTPGRYLNGDIPEILIYNQALSTTQRSIIENYLSTKYGLTISNDKFGTASTQDTNTPNGIFGIGKESDGSVVANSFGGLALTENTTNGNTLGNGEYVMVGNDSGSGLSSSDLGSTGTVSRLARIYGLTKTNTDGIDTKISFDLGKYNGGVPSNTSLSNYKLLYKANYSGDFGSINTTPTLANNILTFDVNNSDLNSGYYTLATTNSSTNPLASFTPPSTPTTLTASKNGSTETSANLTWSGSSSKYIVEYSNDNFVTNFNSTLTSINYATINNLTSGPTYTFRIRGLDTLGNLSDFSTTQSITFSPKITSITPSTGSTVGGESVVVGGSNFAGGGSYAKTLTINNPGTTLTDYQVNFTLDTSSLISANKMRSDCNDLRVFDTDGTTSLNYWIESGCNTTSTSVWVKIPSLGTGSKDIVIK